MTRAALLVLLAACGRIGFDALPGPGGGGGDGGGDTSSGCPPLYTAEEGSCFQVVTDVVPGVTWDDSETACELGGAHIVVVGSLTKAQAVRRIVPANITNFWIATNDRKVEGVYRDVLGGAATYLPWTFNEPTGAAEDCVLMESDLTLEDNTCDTPDDYVCEYDGVTADHSSF